MNIDTRKEEAVTRIDEYLLKITTKKGKMYICPFCGSGTGANKTPAGSLKNYKYSCFSCGKMSMDIFDLIKEYENLPSMHEAFDRAYSFLGIQRDFSNISKKQKTKDKIIKDDDIAQRYEEIKKERQSYINRCFKDRDKSTYFAKRGLNNQLIEKYKLGYDIQMGLNVIPINQFQYTARSQTKNIKYFNSSIPRNEMYKAQLDELDRIPLFNREYLTEPGEGLIYVTEGIIDAISLEAADVKAVALIGTVPQRLLNEIPKDCKKTFVIATDPDKAGRILKDKIISGLKDKNCKFIEFPEFAKIKEGADPDHSESYIIKDMNDLLIHSPLDMIKCVELVSSIYQEEKEAELNEYKLNNAGNHIEEFRNGIRLRASTPAIKTTFPNLDKFLDGGFYEGLYIIGAISSLGKTSFVLQIADQIAAQGRDVIIVSLEMARSELMAKSISRISFLEADQKRMAKTTRGILAGHLYKFYSDEELHLIDKSIDFYQESYAEHLYLYEGIGDIGVSEIRDLVEKHRRLTGNDPLVIIDYLQILKPYNEKYTDKMNTDKAVTELKRITRDFKIPIIAISSFNRENYKSEVSMTAFKESGAIEYSSDVLIGLQLEGAGKKDFDESVAKNKDPREVELKILKNRNGRTGVVIGFEYYPMFNYFTEKTEDFSRKIP